MSSLGAHHFVAFDMLWLIFVFATTELHVPSKTFKTVSLEKRRKDG